MLENGVGRAYFVSLYDGVCDKTKLLDEKDGTMPKDNKWVISSSGHHMFVRFVVFGNDGTQGFHAKIHFGNKFII